MAKKKQEAVPPEEYEDLSRTPMTQAEVLADMEQGVLEDPQVKALLEQHREAPPELPDQPPEPPKAKAEKESEQPDEQAADQEDSGDEPLETELEALADKHGLDPEALEGCETLAEAKRFIDRMYRVMYREGERYQAPMPPPDSRNGPEPVTQAEQDELDALDDDDVPTIKQVKAIKKSLKADLAELKAERMADREREVQRQQAVAAQNFQRILQSNHPELFGTVKNQTRSQYRNSNAAFEAGNILIQGMLSTGRPLPEMEVLVDQAVRMRFGDELSDSQRQVKQNKKREAIQARSESRSIGAPARSSKTPGVPEGPVFEGNAADDPELKRIVESTWQRLRG